MAKICRFDTREVAEEYAREQGLIAHAYRGPGYTDWILLTEPENISLERHPYPWAVRDDGTCEYLSEW